MNMDKGRKRYTLLPDIVYLGREKRWRGRKGKKKKVFILTAENIPLWLANLS